MTPSPVPKHQFTLARLFRLLDEPWRHLRSLRRIAVGGIAIGWLIVMNALQPRLMQEAVGIHPIVVLGSVLIGSKVAGITGAIFGIPIAAGVLYPFFGVLLSPLIASVAMAFSSVTVVSNANRLRRWQPKET